MVKQSQKSEKIKTSYNEIVQAHFQSIVMDFQLLEQSLLNMTNNSSGFLAAAQAFNNRLFVLLINNGYKNPSAPDLSAMYSELHVIVKEKNLLSKNLPEMAKTLYQLYLEFETATNIAFEERLLDHLTEKNAVRSKVIASQCKNIEAKSSPDEVLGKQCANFQSILRNQIPLLTDDMNEKKMNQHINRNTPPATSISHVTTFFLDQAAPGFHIEKSALSPRFAEDKSVSLFFKPSLTKNELAVAALIDKYNQLGEAFPGLNEKEKIEALLVAHQLLKSMEVFIEDGSPTAAKENWSNRIKNERISNIETLAIKLTGSTTIFEPKSPAPKK